MRRATTSGCMPARGGSVINNIGFTVFCNKFGGKHIFHIARIKFCIGDVIDGRINLRIFNCRWHIFNTDNLPHLAGYKIGNGTRAGV